MKNELTVADRLDIRKKLKELQKSVSPAHFRHLVRNVMNMKNKRRGNLILFAAGIKVTKGKLNLSAAIGDFIIEAKTIEAALFANTGGVFPTPFAGQAQLHSRIADLDVAEVNVGKKTFNAVPLRDTARNLVELTLEDALAYVNQLARVAPSETMARAIITGAAMVVIERGPREKAPFDAKRGKLSGTAILTAKAIAKARSYEWQQSPDGITWTPLDGTTRAKKDVTSLTPLVKYYFRFRALTTHGYTDWSKYSYVIIL